ncbi:MAG: hypothetical protein D6690_10700, partial [Nitrospirae bacterium]
MNEGLVFSPTLACQAFVLGYRKILDLECFDLCWTLSIDDRAYVGDWLKRPDSPRPSGRSYKRIIENATHPCALAISSMARTGAERGALRIRTGWAPSRILGSIPQSVP